MTISSPALARAVQAAGAVLVAGGLVAGFAPLPNFFFGCGSAFVGGSLGPDDVVETDALQQCSALRAERQGLALTLLSVGAASALGAAASRWSPATPRVADDLPPIDDDDHAR